MQWTPGIRETGTQIQVTTALTHPWQIREETGTGVAKTHWLRIQRKPGVRGNKSATFFYLVQPGILKTKIISRFKYKSLAKTDESLSLRFNSCSRHNNEARYHNTWGENIVLNSTHKAKLEQKSAKVKVSCTTRQTNASCNAGYCFPCHFGTTDWYFAILSSICSRVGDSKVG